MMTNHKTVAQSCSAARRKVGLAICLFVCTLGLCLPASAQDAGLARNPKGVKLRNLFPRRTVHTPLRVWSTIPPAPRRRRQR